MARQELVNEIKENVRATRFYLDREKLDEKVMRMLATVPRHEFVPQDSRRFAYENRPLSIGYGQTISQPYIVAIMTDLLDLHPDAKVLELGTGSGYQAAILSGLVKEVYTIEIVEALGLKAKERLVRLGYDNVTVKIGDGYYGWDEHAPFDAIIVTAAASHIPPPLTQQLKVGGKMIIPVGTMFLTQQLLLVTKQEKGKLVSRQILPVRFVPVTGGH
ncbi:protein-L-isoaspartate(D-aspartate) O-methyltransferase [Methylomarinum vadi]|uniref:protein-L-isoaspartate(D-aspartate) O-methyltransferase n=1 Tax=Methylomarinum vadi TaxID=438855 RepID=UPI00190F7065|nr:protein-L-isoaspartate(D-aspartate) O-methyltransferase [Methylomarinum vadi]